MEMILEQGIRIESDGTPSGTKVIDINTGNIVYCNAIEFAHKAGENPVVKLTMSNERLEYAIDALGAQINEEGKSSTEAERLAETEREVKVSRMLDGYIRTLTWGFSNDDTKMVVGGNIRAFYYALMKRGDHVRVHEHEEALEDK